MQAITFTLSSLLRDEVKSKKCNRGVNEGKRSSLSFMVFQNDFDEFQKCSISTLTPWVIANTSLKSSSIAL